MKLLPLVLTFGLAWFPSCGGPSDPRALNDEGSKALSSEQYEQAAESYEKALAAMGSDTGSAEWKRAKLGLVQARTRTDASRAKTEFLEFAQGSPSKVTDSDYNLIASKFGDAGKFAEAIAILEVGKKAFPESPHLDALGKDLFNRAKASGDEGALDKLKGLGYVGD
jgi:tetratricopeptide (TPR) repeat protein